MQARSVDQTEAYQGRPLGVEVYDCRMTVRGIFRREPLLLAACRDEEEAFRLRCTADDVRERWKAVRRFLKPIVRRYRGDWLSQDLQPEEEARIRLLIGEVYALIEVHQQVCWEIGTSSL